MGWVLVIYLVHYALFSWWYIEDAAISFTYAHHLAIGAGPVPVVGGEPSEGFSNPTWTLAMAAFDLVGIDPWISAKLLGAVFGAWALWPAERWARRLMPDLEPGLGSVLAPALLAFWPWYVMWNASGLENAFVVAFLAAGCVALLDEVDRDAPKAPWSAVAFALLALSRPEAPLYGAVACAVGLGIAAKRAGFVAAARWGGGFALRAVPIGLAYLAWRYHAFAWALPNTYYAKLASTDKFEPFSWKSKGWPYLRGYAFESGQGFLLPIYVVGMTGARGFRGGIALGLCVVGVVLILPGLGLVSALGLPAEPARFALARIAFLYLAALVLPLLGLGRAGWPGRTLAWAMAGVAVFFAIYAGGDWMKVHRWFSMASIPIAVLYADAMARISPRLAALLVPRAPGWALPAAANLGLVLAAVPAFTGVSRTLGFFQSAETTPYDVYRRVRYMQDVQRRLHLDDVTLMDVDMGAHLWWSGFGIVDMAGLVDVPMAHHKYQKAFVGQYVFEERKPEFAHVHGSWATRTKIPRVEAWKGYVEIEPYPLSPRTTHPGNHVRKDLIQTGRWLGPGDREISYAEGVEIVGWNAPAAAVSGALYVELAWRSPQPRPEDLRTVLFLSGPGGFQSWEIPPGYDWLLPVDWDRGELVETRATLPLRLPPGSYDLGLVSYGWGQALSKGAFHVVELPPGATTDAPVFAQGEVRFPGAITILPAADARALADTGLADAVAAAEKVDCDGAEAAWRIARRRLDRDDAWQADARATADLARARCLAARGATYAGRSPDRALAVAAAADLARARRLAPRDPSVDAAGITLADALVAESRNGTSSARYQALHLALLADPSRAAVRREAEALRDQSLGLTEQK